MSLFFLIILRAINNSKSNFYKFVDYKGINKKNMKKIFITLIMFCGFLPSSIRAQHQNIYHKVITNKDIRVGAERTEIYFPWIKDKAVALVVNHTSLFKDIHLVDTLLNAGIDIRKIFSPEHGFRGDAEAGEHVKNYIDKKTGIPVVSLYGTNFKPKPGDLKNIDIVIFDIQDVGVRFYTYISTMHYVMEACAEQKIAFIVLDRPNPNGFFVDGPVLDMKYSSFIGKHPVPLVHGMTIAEYATMINNEGWLKGGIKCDLKYVTIDSYNHTCFYHLPVKPSPNLPNMNSVYLYPSLGLFEGTVISIGRGTDLPFQIIGHPKVKNGYFSFTPKSISGASTNPKFKGVKCYGYNLSEFATIYVRDLNQIYIFWLLEMYNRLNNEGTFFKSSFNMLAGNAELKKQIIDGVSEEDIRKSWQQGIKKFKVLRKKYILYPDFE